MKSRWKVKRKVGALMIILMVSPVTLMTGTMTTMIANEEIRLMIERARERLQYWGEDYNTLAPSPSLDPGGGGGGDMMSNHYPRTLLLFDGAEDLNSKQVRALKTNFSASGYFLFYSTADSKSAFLEDLKNANTITTNRVCLGFVGEGTLVESQQSGREDNTEVPALVMRDGSKVIGDDIKWLRESAGNYHWKFHAVFLYACYSAYTTALAKSFKGLGAKVVFGFGGKVVRALAEEVNGVFWRNYNTTGNSLEAVYSQTKSDFKHAHSIAKTIANWIKEHEDIFRFLLNRILLDPSLRAAVVWLADLIISSLLELLGLWGTIALFLIMLVAVIAIVFILNSVSAIAFPLVMMDYSSTETKI